jgi:hypothetical protein
MAFISRAWLRRRATNRSAPKLELLAKVQPKTAVKLQSSPRAARAARLVGADLEALLRSSAKLAAA